MTIIRSIEQNQIQHDRPGSELGCL